ncbi:MAG: hypothetical protein H0M93_01760 [Methanophagales archaeon]|nr:hypothetical protein [Methanophagales archaeon]
MGTKEMIEKIIKEASEESERLISEARENGNKKYRDAVKEIELQKRRFIELEERKGVADKERITRAANRDARKSRWKTKEEAAKKVLHLALEQITAVKTDGFMDYSYPSILAGLIKKSAISIAGDIDTMEQGPGQEQELEVILSEDDAASSSVDHEMLTELEDEISRDSGVNVRLSLSDERIKSVGGVIIRRKDGTVVVNNMFEQRMARLSSSLREEIEKRLFVER